MPKGLWNELFLKYHLTPVHYGALLQKLQYDYTKQSFYIWLSKEERKQYEYEDYLLDKINDLESKGE